jgi:hypothetical protein
LARACSRRGQAPLAIDQGQRLGRFGRLALDQLMDAQFAFIGLAGRVEAGQARLFGGVQQAQLAQGGLGPLDDLRQQAQPVASQALHARRLEQVGGVGERGRQLPGAFVGAQGQVELGVVTRPAQAAHLKAGQGTWRLGGAGMFGLVVEHHLEQRAVAQAALGLQGIDQLLERQVLVAWAASVVWRTCASRSKLSSPRRSACSTWVLTKKPIRRSVSRRLRLAIGTPTRMRGWPL